MELDVPNKQLKLSVEECLFLVKVIDKILYDNQALPNKQERNILDDFQEKTRNLRHKTSGRFGYVGQEPKEQHGTE